MNLGPLELLVILYMFVGIPSVVVSFLKGHWIYGLLGIPIVVLALVGALMPAKPNSMWAKQGS